MRVGCRKNLKFVFLAGCFRPGRRYWDYDTTERSPIEGGDNSARGFPLSACCYIPLQPPLPIVGYFIGLFASERHHVTTAFVSERIG
jgi:hypothetical protein